MSSFAFKGAANYDTTIGETLKHADEIFFSLVFHFHSILVCIFGVSRKPFELFEVWEVPIVSVVSQQRSKVHTS